MTKFRTRGAAARWRLFPALLGLSIVAGLAVMPPAVLHADEGDQERALKALRAGEVLPLRAMLDEVERRFSGDVLEVELEEDDDGGRRIWAYEIKLISPDGNVIKLKIDAKTKEILEIKGRGADRARRK